ncbi:MAG: TetR family transcriptional regulator [Caldibacillus thermoamylovorans]
MELEEKDVTKKDLILQATLQLIGDEGFDAISSRKIAKRANVNVALINYYFGSKEKLLNQAFHVFLSTLKETFLSLENESINPQDRLKKFFIEYVHVFQAYPSIIQLILQKNTFEFDSHKEYVNFIRSLGLKKLVVIMQEITGEQDEQKCMVMISQLLGAIFLPMIMEPVIKDTTPFRLPDVETHINILFQHYFHRYHLNS